MNKNWGSVVDMLQTIYLELQNEREGIGMNI